jgi:hypothetical protein
LKTEIEKMREHIRVMKQEAEEIRSRRQAERMARSGEIRVATTGKLDKALEANRRDTPRSVAPPLREAKIRLLDVATDEVAKKEENVVAKMMAQVAAKKEALRNEGALRAFYKVHNPEAVDKVQAVLTHYSLVHIVALSKMRYGAAPAFVHNGKPVVESEVSVEMKQEQEKRRQREEKVAEAADRAVPKSSKERMEKKVAKADGEAVQSWTDADRSKCMHGVSPSKRKTPRESQEPLLARAEPTPAEGDEMLPEEKKEQQPLLAPAQQQPLLAPAQQQSLLAPAQPTTFEADEADEYHGICPAQKEQQSLLSESFSRADEMHQDQAGCAEGNCGAAACAVM